jgi:hypothetical protein
VLAGPVLAGPVLAGPVLADPGQAGSRGCGNGPQLTIGGVRVRTTVTGLATPASGPAPPSPADGGVTDSSTANGSTANGSLANGSMVRFTACAPVTVGAGTTEVTESATDAYDVQDVVLTPSAAAGASAATSDSAPNDSAPSDSATNAPAAPADVLEWGQSQRSLRVGVVDRSYLEVNENFNAGWQASLDGQVLQPVRLDGWKQAWVLPAGSSGVVTLTYQPAALYRAALIAGLATLIACLLLAVALPRRLVSGGGRHLRRRPPESRQPARPRHATAPLPILPVPGLRRHGLRGQGLVRQGLRGQGLLTGLIATAALAMAGLLLGGYTGAVLLPAVTGALVVLSRRGDPPAPPGRPRRDWLATRRPPLLGWLVALASVAGALGTHLLFSGDNGPVVTALSNGIPQVICIIVIGGIASELVGSAEAAP